MGPATRSSRLLHLAALTVLSTTITTSSASVLNNNLFLRQDSEVCSGLADYTQCGSDFPSSFCCSAGTQCVGFDAGQGANSGAICCPNGSCTQFQPIACNANAFDAEAHPDNPIHISFQQSDSDLPTCAGRCCPPGYTCQQNSCVLATSAASSSAATATSTATSTVALSSAASTPTSTSTSDTTSSSPTAGPISTTCSAFPAPAILAGLFPGLTLGSLLTLAILLCLQRHQRSSALRNAPGADSDSALGPVRAHISDPIYAGSSNERIDFLRRHTRTGKPDPADTDADAYTYATSSINASPPLPPLSRVRSLFSRSGGGSPTRRDAFDRQGLGTNTSVLPAHRTPEVHELHTPRTPPHHTQPWNAAQPWVNHTSAEHAGKELRTPEHQIKREPSMESIIISPPPGLQVPPRPAPPGDRQTTFGDVLKLVGLGVREPMPYMGTVDAGGGNGGGNGGRR